MLSRQETAAHPNVTQSYGHLSGAARIWLDLRGRLMLRSTAGRGQNWSICVPRKAVRSVHAEVSEVVPACAHAESDVVFVIGIGHGGAAEPGGSGSWP